MSQGGGCKDCDKDADVVAVEKLESYAIDVTEEPNPGPRLWFSHHFVCPRYQEYWTLPDAGSNVWHRVGDKVVLSNAEGHRGIWLLHNTFDENGSQLGVWPD